MVSSLQDKLCVPVSASFLSHLGQTNNLWKLDTLNDHVFEPKQITMTMWDIYEGSTICFAINFFSVSFGPN